ncbi:inositol monophosphatase [Herbidospora sp. NEAU-GS84]|uniref:Inositol-1-monophosphatase n=1 Tax=Herbidospora solisilvae TaxID=2696284 RepID=A0A7C9NJC0_9ACTN|nr:inositol monophosphatase family protein [Herbidospora solisilvae]NAS24598.1 inositol monophosphatase [Herbidospora solisilvae]
MNLDMIANRVRSLALHQGERIAASVTAPHESGDVSTKSSLGDLVSQLDRDIESSLISQLLEIAPEAAIIGEEGGARGGSSLSWVIDPIDGSTNVVHGLPHAAISIALCDNLVPTMGIVHNPFTRQTFQGIRGVGAFRYDHGTVMSREKLRVSARTNLSLSLVGFGLPYDRNRADLIFSTALRTFVHCQDLRRRGSASLDLISVAAGDLDAHFELDLRVWDIAAATVILEEAGGRLTQWNGQPITWRSSADKLSVVASNSIIHEELREIISQHNQVGEIP